MDTNNITDIISSSIPSIVGWLGQGQAVYVNDWQLFVTCQYNTVYIGSVEINVSDWS
jgi:hypothetical protein